VRVVVRHWRSCAEQLAAPSQLLPFETIGQQAVMADTQEAVGKHVLQEAVDEFFRREGNYSSKCTKAKPRGIPGGPSLPSSS